MSARSRPGSVPSFVARHSPFHRDRVAIGFAVVAVTVTLGGLALENLQTRTLRCVDGVLVAHRGGVVPWASRVLHDPRMPPLEIPPSLCHEVRFSSQGELERHYFHLAGARAFTASQAPRGTPTSLAPERGEAEAAPRPPRGPLTPRVVEGSGEREL